MRKALLIQSFMLMLIAIAPCENALAKHSYVFSCSDSKINASIKYSVLGRYQATFSECSGEIVFDKIQTEVKSVYLEIKTKSILSNCQWCDKVVLSPQLLNSEKYPTIVFEGNNFKRNDLGYVVTGTMDLHGVKKDLQSQFTIEELEDGRILAKGKWLILRKNFNISWNKLLDHGGVLVGDHITVDWEILARKI